MTALAPLDQAHLPKGIRARFVPDINGLTMHVLEAGFEQPGRPCVLLLHGFPELGFSWRKVMLPLAAAGYHVIAPDQRGYGRTTGCDTGYDGDLSLFRPLNLVRDALGLVSALGYRSVGAVIGHDFGSPVAAWCALVRPDVFRSVVLMSAPFGGPPQLPFDTANAKPRNAASDINADFAALSPPRKHYQWYYSTRQANDNMWKCGQGVHAFLRAYYHHKSADWTANKPYALASYSAAELAKLPTYYVMEADKGMAETVAREMPDAAAIAACRWLPDTELGVYSEEYGRTGFQGGLNWYRVRWDSRFTREAEVFSGRTIDVPSAFIAGKSDWGVYQAPPAFEKMQGSACTKMLGCHLIDGAGHWVQQEQPEAVSRLLLDFLKTVSGA
jgi:pimeloyl-ACP methyl ester carboxylesterase